MVQKELSAAHDYPLCRQVWQRVNPQEEPYPMMNSATQENELQLPGAEENPCCMGTEAQESLKVLQGFIRGEMADQKKYAVLAVSAPTQRARKLFCTLARDEKNHLQRLLATYYLITGERYEEHLVLQKAKYPSFPAMLRSFYHEEVCGGLNYLRASEETLDYCLEKLLAELSQDEYRHAEDLLDLLGSCMKL